MTFHLGCKKYTNFRPYSNLDSDDEIPSIFVFRLAYYSNF